MKEKIKLILFSHLSDLYSASGKDAKIKIEFSKFLIAKYINNIDIDADKEFEEFKEKHGDRLRINDWRGTIGKIIREELSSLNEVLIEDPDIAKKVDELSSLVNQIKSLKEQLKLMENNAKQIEDILRPILDGLKDTEERILETQSSVAYIERRGYSMTKPKYKEAYLLALTKVNDKIKTILQEALAATNETTYVTSGISARPNEGKIVEEGIGSFFSGLWGKLKGFVSKLKGHNNDIKKYNDVIKKLSK